MDYEICIKINGSKLNPSDHVKYLGIFLGKNLAWDYHISQLSNKLSRSNGVMYKLRKYIPKQTLLSVYYSIFYSHLTYACQVWSLTTQHNIDTIKILHTKCVRIINFAPFNGHTNILFNSDKLLKFQDIIKFEQMKLVFEFKTNTLPLDLNNLFQENKEINGHLTRNVAKKGLYIPQIRTKSYGSRSLKYSAAVLWNNHLKYDDRINTFTNLKNLKNI